MKNVNAIVRVNVQNLRVPLLTFQARQLCAFVAELRDVPDDVTSVGVVVFKPNGQHFAVSSCSQDANGYWRFYGTPTMFPDAGEAKYEVIGTNEEGQNAPLGVGKLLIDPFYSGSTPIPESGTIPVMEIYDQNGVAHRISAKNVGTAENPDWTSVLED